MNWTVKILLHRLTWYAQYCRSVRDHPLICFIYMENNPFSIKQKSRWHLFNRKWHKSYPSILPILKSTRYTIYTSELCLKQSASFLGWDLKKSSGVSVHPSILTSQCWGSGRMQNCYWERARHLRHGITFSGLWICSWVELHYEKQKMQMQCIYKKVENYPCKKTANKFNKHKRWTPKQFHIILAAETYM